MKLTAGATMYTKEQVQTKLGCTEGELRSLHETGRVPLPGYFAGVVRAYTDDNVTALRDTLEVSRLPNTIDVCREVGITRAALIGLQTRGLPAPTKRYGKRDAWTAEDVTRLKQWVQAGK